MRAMVDDRGKRVAARALGAREVGDRLRGLSAEEMARLERRGEGARPLGWELVRAGVMIVVVMAISFGVASGVYAVFGTRIAMIPGLVAGMMCGVVVLSWWQRGREIANQRVYARVGVCPACGYSLPEEVGADGMAVCSECGGAWRREGT